MAAGSIVVDLLMKTGSFETDTKRAEKSLKDLEKSAIDAGKKIGAAFAGVATATAVLIRSQINAADAMGKAAASAGVTTESLSALAYAAEMSGSSQQEMTAALGRLSVQMANAASGSKTAEAAFKAIGVTVTDANGKLKSSDEVFRNIAERFAKMPDGVEKTTAAIDIFGRSGANLIPLLNSGADGLDAMRAEAERLGIVIDTETSVAAAQFNDNITRLQKSLSGLGISAAQQVLPTLISLTDAMQQFGGATAIGEFAGKAFKVVLETVAIVAANVAFVLRGMGRELGGIAAQLAAIARFDFRGAGNIRGLMLEDAKAARAELEAFERRVMGLDRPAATPTTAPALAAPGASFLAARGGSSRDGTAAALREAKREEEAYSAWMQQMREGELTRFFEIEDRRISQAKKEEEEYQRWMQEMRNGELDRYLEIQALREERDKGYWERWLEAASEAMTSFNDLAAGVIENFSAGFGNAFEKMVFDSQSLGDAIRNLAEGMARSVINALGQMAGQWLAYQAVQALVGKTTAASAATAQTFNAMASQQMAAINAFASTAAIPIIGPAAAPAAAAAAMAATSPFVATIASLGAAAAGARATGGPVSSDKPYLVGERGAELFVPNTSGAIVPNHKLGGGDVTVNVIQSRERAGQTEERNRDGMREVDVFVADIMGDGPRAKAIRQAFGLQRRGY